MPQITKWKVTFLIRGFHSVVEDCSIVGYGAMLTISYELLEGLSASFFRVVQGVMELASPTSQHLLSYGRAATIPLIPHLGLYNEAMPPMQLTLLGLP